MKDLVLLTTILIVSTNVATNYMKGQIEKCIESRAYEPLIECCVLAIACTYLHQMQAYL